jgi:tetratricopeptide (TPR) repeat protein
LGGRFNLNLSPYYFITAKNIGMTLISSLKYIFIYALFTQCALAQDCKEGINLLPMYGNVVKCPEQVQSDIDFLAFADTKFTDRKEAAIAYIKLGWNYFGKNDNETSMKRFNQAWLLDSLNADIYWGFGNLLGRMGKYQSSIPYFEKSIKLYPGNAKVYENLATSYGQLFTKTRELVNLNQAVVNLRKANNLDKNNPRILAQLTAAYTYFPKKDSAYKYLDLTDKIDQKAINPEVREALKQKKR